MGWSIADRTRTELVTDALTAAAFNERLLSLQRSGVATTDWVRPVHVSSYADLSGRLGVVQSMGAVGSGADNALAESFNATPKREILAGAAGWNTPAEGRREVFA